jgi:(2S)-methylsuccinyl-CoA dehydrogenase
VNATPDMITTASIIELAESVIERAIRELGARGGADANQVLAYDLAHAASAVATARSLIDYGAKGDVEASIASAFTAEVVHDLSAKVFGREDLWGVTVARPCAVLHRFVPRPSLPRHTRNDSGSTSLE